LARLGWRAGQAADAQSRWATRHRVEWTMKRGGSILTPLEIRARLAELQMLGYPADGIRGFAEGLMSFCSGEAAELALAELVARIPADDILEMAKTQVRFPRPSAHAPDYLSAPQWLAIDLAALGFLVEEGEEWLVALPDGTSVNAWLGESTCDGKTIQLCRLGVLAIGLSEMRRPRGDEAPPF